MRATVGRGEALRLLKIEHQVTNRREYSLDPARLTGLSLAATARCRHMPRADPANVPDIIHLEPIPAAFGSRSVN